MSLKGNFNEREALLKRFRSLLLEQRDNFRSYLDVLEKQKKNIAEFNAEELEAQIAVQEQFNSDILSLQKCIEPVKALFRAGILGAGAISGKAKSTSGAARSAPPDIEELGATLSHLKIEALSRLNENRKLLEEKMRLLKSEIKELRTNPLKAKQKKVYAAAAPSLLDISG